MQEGGVKCEKVKPSTEYKKEGKKIKRRKEDKRKKRRKIIAEGAAGYNGPQSE